MSAPTARLIREKSMRTFRELATILIPTLFASGLASAAPLDDLLQCADWDALARPPREIADGIASDTRAQCRVFALANATTVECAATRAISVFGLPTQEFGFADARDGAHRVSVVFRAAPERVRDAVAARLKTSFAPGPDDSFIARLDNPTTREIRVSPREDGSTTLVCLRQPPRDEAEGIAQGIDAQRGGIAGHLSFPGGTLPPMRVCAVPREPTLRARCIVTAVDTADFLIAGLTPGDYDVASFALSGNANRFVGAHASRLDDCGPNRTDCAGGVLVPVTVRAGQVITDVDPDRFYTQLPARFDIVYGD